MNRRTENKINKQIDDRNELALNVMMSQLNTLFASFNTNFKTSTDNLSVGIKSLVEAQKSTVILVDQFSQSMTKAVKDLSLKTSINNLVDAHEKSIQSVNNSLIPSQTKLAKAFSNAGKVNQFTPSQIPEPKVTESVFDERKPGLWKSLKEGSLRQAWQGLIADIKEFKAVIALSAVTMAALNKESKLNELRTFTDGLLSGTDSLKGFNKAVSQVAVNTGESFDVIAEKAAGLKKYLGLEFTDDTFKGFLETQTKLTKATGLSDDVLNKMFMTIRVGTKNKHGWLDVTKSLTAALMGMAGKTGVTKQSMEEFTSSLTDLISTMRMFNAPQEAIDKAVTIWSNSFKYLSEVGIPEISTKLKEAITNYHDPSNDTGRMLLSRLGITAEEVNKSLQTGDFKSVIEKAMTGIDNMADEISKDPRFAGAFKQFLSENFGPDAMKKIVAASKSGDLKRAMSDILNFGDIPIKPSLAEENYNAIHKSVATSLSSIKEAFQDLMATVGEAPLKVLASGLSTVAEAAKGAFGWFQQLPESTKEFIATSASIGLALTALVPILGAVSLAAAGLGPIALGLSGLAVAATALGAGFAVLIAKWDPVKSFLTEIGLGGFAESLESLGKGLRNLWDYIKELWNAPSQIPFLSTILDWAKSLANIITDIIPLFKFIKMIGEVGTQGITEGIKNRVQSSWIGVKDWFWKGNTGEGVSESELKKKSELDDRYNQLKLDQQQRELTRQQSGYESILKNSNISPVIPRGEAQIPPKLESSINEIKDNSNTKLAEDLKQNQPAVAQPVQATSTSKEVEVTDFDKLLSLVAQALSMYQEDRNRPTVSQTYNNLPLTRSEAINQVDQMTSDQWSWGTI